jgi:hypothetical protein
MSKITNARIDYTRLGLEDHGIMTFTIGLEWSGSGQGFGGLALDMWSKEKECRVGHPDSIMIIRRIIEAVGVSNWEDLKGKYVRIRHESDSWGAKIEAIGHIVDDEWCVLSDFYKKV